MLDCKKVTDTVNELDFPGVKLFRLGLEFEKWSDWQPQPLLHDKPRLIGDFQKNDVFVEKQVFV